MPAIPGQGLVAGTTLSGSARSHPHLARPEAHPVLPEKVLHLAAGLHGQQEAAARQSDTAKVGQKAAVTVSRCSVGIENPVEPGLFWLGQPSQIEGVENNGLKVQEMGRGDIERPVQE